MASYVISSIIKVVDAATHPLRDISAGFNSLSLAFKGLKKENAAMMDLGRSLTKAGRWLSWRVTAPLVATATLSTKAAMDINKSMADIGTLIPGNIDRLKELRKIVQDTSIATGRYTEETVSGLYQVIRYYGDSVDIAKKLQIVSEAALASKATASEAAFLAGEMATAFGDKSTEAMEKFLSQAHIVQTRGAGEFKDLVTAMGRLLPTAPAMGVQSEELMASFAVLSKFSPGQLSKTGFQLSTMLEKMAQYPEIIERIQQVGFRQTLKDLNRELGGNINYIRQLFGGSRSLAGAFGLIVSESKEFDKALKEMDSAVGFLNDGVKEQKEGINKVGFQWMAFKVHLQVVRQELGELLLPYLYKLITFFEKLLKKFQSLSPSTKDWIIKLSMLAATIGPVLLVLGNLIMLVIGLKIAAALLGVTIGALLLPFTGLLILSALLALAGIFIIKKWDKVKEWFKDFIDFMKNGWETLSNGFKNFYDDVIKPVKDFIADSAVYRFFERVMDKFLYGPNTKGSLSLGLTKNRGATGTWAEFEPELWNERGGKRGEISPSTADVTIRLIADPGTGGQVLGFRTSQGDISLNLINEIYAGGLI